MPSLVHQLHNENSNDVVKTGVYTITSKINGKMYVGSTSTLDGRFKSESGFINRWRGHVSELNRNHHCNTYLQNHVNKYGIEDLKFEILEECEPGFAVGLEQYWINQLDSLNTGFNLTAPQTVLRGENRPNYIKVDNEKIIDDYLHSNLSMDEISNKFKVSKHKIYCVLQDNNVNSGRRNRGIDFDLMYSEYLNSTLTTEQISEKYQLKRGYLSRKMIRLNLPTKLDIVRANINKIYLEYSSGIKIGQLAKQNKVSAQMITKIFKENNLPLLKFKNKHKETKKQNALKREIFLNRIISIHEEYLNSDLSLAKASKKFNIPLTSLWKAFKNNNLKIKEYAICSR